MSTRLVEAMPECSSIQSLTILSCRHRAAAPSVLEASEPGHPLRERVICSNDVTTFFITSWTFGTFGFPVSSMPPSSRIPAVSLVSLILLVLWSFVPCGWFWGHLGRFLTFGGTRIFRRDGPLNSTSSRHGSFSLLVSLGSPSSWLPQSPRVKTSTPVS
jgi:hypothetical protein